MKHFSSTNFAVVLLAAVVLLSQTAALPAPAAAEAPAAPPVDPFKIAFDEIPEPAPQWLAGYRVRFALRVVGDPTKVTSATVMARVPTGGWLRPDGSDIAVQNAAGQAIPVTIRSHDPNGDTIIQFPRTANDRWYWAYAGNAAAPAAAAPAAPEGLVAEFRDFAHEDIDTWAGVVEGLKKSESVIGNAPLSEIITNSNPARPHDPRKFATSYRGYLNIKAAGAYRFLVNAQDASFLFIDGLKVFERGGQNERLVGAIPVSKNGNLVDLTAGVHPFEIHHVVGDNNASFGFCVFLWVPPGANQWAYVPPEVLVQPLYATVASVQESAADKQVATFAWGIDDVLATVGQTLYLVRFEAQGGPADQSKLTWDFGDGTTGIGGSPMHVYFKDGPFIVKLKSAANLPAHQRRIVAWNTPVTASPLSLGKAVQSLAASDWPKLDLTRLRQVFSFLQVCEQPERWPLLEAVSRQMLTVPGSDPPVRASAYASLMDALAHQGKADAALALVKPALAELGKVPSLAIRINMAAADVHYRHLREIKEAAAIYKSIIDDHRRLELPNVRLAAVRMGDLFAETGEMPKAAEAYRLAATLGGAQFEGTAQTGAITRGAMLRVAEQRLKAGDIAQTRQLMEKIELQYPEQKLEGLYRFLRAEADRMGGRYEDAIGHYEILLKLPQWGGYRPKALFGIADSYNRAGDDAKATKWLDLLEEASPTFYEEQKLPDYRRTLDLRAARAKRAAAAAPGEATMPFTGFVYGFEPAEPMQNNELVNCAFTRGLGLGGTHVGLVEAIPASKGYVDAMKRLRNINSGGYFWAEIWYRESLDTLSANSHIHMTLYGTGDQTDPQMGVGTHYFNRSYGEWRKLGFLLRAPQTQDGRIGFSLRQVLGAMELDSFSVKPVTDRQYDAMTNFIQRTGAP